MNVRALTLAAVSAAFLVVSCSDDESPTTPTGTSPSSTTPTTTTSPSAPSANRAPGPMRLDFQPKGTVLAGGTNVSFGAFVTDPDGDSLTYKWDFQDEEFTTSNSGVTHTFGRARDYKVKVTASDGKGGSSSAEATVVAGTLEGTWVIENAVHENLYMNVSHSGSASISGSFTNGATFSGHVGDPYRVVVRLDAPNSYCLQTGTYVGTADPNLSFIDFPGGGCRGFQARRR
jgi:hypothetical protein